MLLSITFMTGFSVAHSYYTGVELTDLILGPFVIVLMSLMIVLQHRIKQKQNKEEKDVTITVLQYIKDDLIAYMPPKDEEFARNQINLIIKRMRKW